MAMLDAAKVAGTGIVACALLACGGARSSASAPAGGRPEPSATAPAARAASFPPLTTNPLTKALAARLSDLLPELEAVYKDLHENPELSMHETRTAKVAADWIERFGYEVSRNVGGTGVVGVLRNGAGPTVMLRADMDALPMTEATGLAYASTVKANDDSGANTQQLPPDRERPGMLGAGYGGLQNAVRRARVRNAAGFGQ